MKIGIDGLKMPEAARRGPLASFEHARSYGMAGIFFASILDLSPTLDRAALREVRAHADDLGMYLEAGLGKINPYCSAESPELRAIGEGDIVAGLRRMMEGAADIGCLELWASLSNFKPQYPGRLANDRFRTDVTWTEQLAASERLLKTLAPIARDLGVHINLETHDEVTSFELVRLVETVGPDATGIVHDTANVLQRGEHPVLSARRVAPYVRQTHIKDAYVARAPGGLDFQTRPCGAGIVDFRAILPIIAAANPAMTLTIEPAQSTADKPRALVPRQRIEIDDPIWLAAHPDLTSEELAAYKALVDAYEKRIETGEVVSWETYERDNYGWPTYQTQRYGYAQAIGFIKACADHLTTIAAELSLPLDAPPPVRAA